MKKSPRVLCLVVLVGIVLLQGVCFSEEQVASNELPCVQVIFDRLRNGPSPDSFTVSPDGQRVAYVVPADAGRRVKVDGKEGKGYGGILEGSLIFSPDSKRAAYVAVKGKKRIVVIEEVESREWGAIGVPRKTLVNYGWLAEAPQEAWYQASGVAAPAFSPDSRQVAYGAERNGTWFLVVDGVEQSAPREDCDLITNPAFSPDGARIAYLMRSKDAKWRVVLGDSVGKEYDGIGGGSLRFSPDGRLAYAAKRDNKWFILLEGAEGEHYDGVKSLTWSSNGRLAFVAKNGEDWIAVLDGVKGKAYKEIRDLTFSPDGKRAAYAAKRGDVWVAVVDGVEGKEYREKVWAIVFSPDGKRVAYAASNSRVGDHFAVLDGRESKRYNCFLGRPAFIAPNALRFWTGEIRIPGGKNRVCRVETTW